MVDLVETMLKLHKDLPKAKMPHEQESLKRTIEATDKQIDGSVYEFYGLTEDEVRIVEGGLHDESLDVDVLRAGHAGAGCRDRAV